MMAGVSLSSGLDPIRLLILSLARLSKANDGREDD